MKFVKILFLIIIFNSCSSQFHLSKDEFLQQTVNYRDKSEKTTSFPMFTKNIMILFSSTYDANNIEKVLCWNDKNELVFLYPDNNTKIEITSKLTNEIDELYFDTVFFKEGKLIGLTSRSKKSIPSEIDTDDIKKIEIFDRFPTIEKAIIN